MGDAWRTRRLIRLVDDLSAQPTGSIPLASRGWAETKVAYRLLDNDALDGEGVRLIAGFGGFLGRKHDGHPGPKAIWEGMQKVSAFAIALEAGRAAYARDG